MTVNLIRRHASSAGDAATVPVWDPVVRIGHWVLVLAFAIAYLTGEEEGGGPEPLHVWSGYAIAVIVLLRVLWGFVGSPHARFADFVRGPSATIRYLFDLPRGRARRYLGHSPAGGAMVLALLMSLAATLATGLIAYADQGRGPLAAKPQLAIERNAAERGRVDGEEHHAGDSRDESAMGELHGVLANITLGLVVIHVCGVALASVAHRENLVLAMFTGRKRSAHERPPA